MIKLGAVVLLASFVAGLAVTAPGLSPQVEAHTVEAPAVESHTYAIKGERMEIRNFGPACSDQGWPYFETKCLHDTNSATHAARTVRMVGTDRAPARR